MLKPMKQAIVTREKAGRVTIYDYQPGNGTRYIVQITNLTGMVDENRGMVTLVNMPRMGSCPVQGYAPHTSYIQEKMNVGAGDAEALEALLRHHFAVDPQG